MASLRPGFQTADQTLSLQLPHPSAPLADGQSQSRVALMRRYEIAALMPNLAILSKTHVAPATALFESCASAFARGTLIPTVRGPVAIEDLLPGDYIETAEGTEPVTWIGSTTYIPGRSDDGTTLTHLTRITTDACGPGKPAMDLMVGPAARHTVRNAKLSHLLGQDAVLAPIADYADGDRFVQVTPGGTVQLFHLMVRRHTTINVGGIEMESYHPGQAASQLVGHNMRALFLSLFPNIQGLEDFGQVSMTRTSREVIESLIDT